MRATLIALAVFALSFTTAHAESQITRNFVDSFILKTPNGKALVEQQDASSIPILDPSHDCDARPCEQWVLNRIIRETQSEYE